MITPKFANPPVAELVFGVMFGSSRPLKTAEVGLYWNTIKEGFPEAQDAPAVPPQVEMPLSPSLTFNLQINMQSPLRRSMFFNKEHTRLVQLQDDRFLFNWKRASEDEPYPSYSAVSKDFFREFERFESFLKDHGLAPLTIRQFELSYVNLITDELGLAMVGKTGVLIDHIRDTSPSRILPEPAFFNWVTSYDLPENDGRLHISAQTAFLPPLPKPILRLDLTARGIRANPNDTMKEWFETAHQWITCGFADSTVHLLHEMIWKRQP